MGSHQLPQIGNEDKFEDLICDLFNILDSTNSYKKFGRKGHQQKGIDVFSSVKDIVIQCKKKDLTRKEIEIRRELMNDIEKDINKVISQDLKIKFDTLYFTSTYKDHPDIDEFCEFIKESKKLDFEIIYWGWDTLEGKIIGYQKLLEKYFQNFIIKSAFKEESFLRNLNLKKKIEVDFGDWLNYFPKDRKRRSRMILRAFDRKQYPYKNEPNEYGEYSWFRAEIKRLFFNGIEFIYGIEPIFVFEDGTWDFEVKNQAEKYQKINAEKLGQINYSDIVDYDLNGDEYYICPHIFCKFEYQGLPFEKTYYWNNENKELPMYFEMKTKR